MEFELETCERTWLCAVMLKSCLDGRIMFLVLGPVLENIEQDWVTVGIATKFKVPCLIPQRLNLDRYLLQTFKHSLKCLVNKQFASRKCLMTSTESSRIRWLGVTLHVYQ
jgi:hypothetical protein